MYITKSDKVATSWSVRGRRNIVSTRSSKWKMSVGGRKGAERRKSIVRRGVECRQRRSGASSKGGEASEGRVSSKKKMSVGGKRSAKRSIS